MDYELIRSKRKTLSIEVNLDGRIIVRVPLKCSQKAVDAFVAGNEQWVAKSLVKAENRRREKDKYSINEDDIKYYKEKAKAYLPARTEYWSSITGLKPGYVHITSAAKRYGSCNSSNGICFSYRLMAYPDEVIDYVILHELAHIKHKNHSRAFYGLIAEFMPDYKNRENILKHKGENQNE